MTFWLGLVLIGFAVGVCVVFGGMFVDKLDVAVVGLGIMVVPLFLLLLGLGVALVLGIQMDPQPMLGSCYKAVEKGGYMPISTGKTTIIIPYKGMDLVEVRCP
jgi:hypothetical protein